MSKIEALMAEVEKFGARLVPAGGGKLLLADGARVPNWLREAVKSKKPDILKFLEDTQNENIQKAPAPQNAAEFFSVYGQRPWQINAMIPHAGRRTLKPEMRGTRFDAWCPECGVVGNSSYDADLARGFLGTWHCSKHRLKGRW